MKFMFDLLSSDVSDNVDSVFFIEFKEIRKESSENDDQQLLRPISKNFLDPQFTLCLNKPACWTLATHLTLFLGQILVPCHM